MFSCAFSGLFLFFCEGKSNYNNGSNAFVCIFFLRYRAQIYNFNIHLFFSANTQSSFFFFLMRQIKTEKKKEDYVFNLLLLLLLLCASRFHSLRNQQLQPTMLNCSRQTVTVTVLTHNCLGLSYNFFLLLILVFLFTVCPVRQLTIAIYMLIVKKKSELKLCRR